MATKGEEVVSFCSGLISNSVIEHNLGTVNIIGEVGGNVFTTCSPLFLSRPADCSLTLAGLTHHSLMSE